MAERAVTAPMRTARNGHAGGVLWLTGLSGAGKTTLAIETERLLFRKGYQICVLDGDDLRGGLNADLAFSPAHRSENIRRVGETAGLFAGAGLVAISACISPYRADRALARRAARSGFHEIYVKASLATCEARDVKGLYRRARAGEIRDFTGVSAPYEAPGACELVVETDDAPVADSVRRILDYVERALPLDPPRPGSPAAPP